MSPFDFVIYSAQRFPAKMALSCDGRCVSYSELERRTRRLADFLTTRCCVRPGDCVGIWLSNCCEYVEILLAAWLVGAVPDLYSPRYSHAAVLEQMDQSGVSVIFVGGYDDALKDGVDKILHQCEARVVSVGFEKPGCDAYESVLGGGSVWNDDLRFDDDEVGLQLYTSGTTSRPKCVQLTRKGIVSVAIAGASASGTNSSDVVMATFPLFHAAGLSVLSALFVGAKVVLCPLRKPAYLVDQIGRYRATKLSLPPILLERVLDYCEEAPADLSTLNTIMYGSSRMPAELVERCRTIIPGMGFYQVYGMTESGASVTALTRDDHEDASLLDTVGRPLLGVSVKIVDVSGDSCLAGEVGEILVRSDMVMKGYRGEPELMARAVRDGWYYTSDMGFIDQRGYLHLTGRKDRMLISGGENIFPEEIEECISGMPGVLDVAVVGVDDAVWGKVPVAFVVVDPAVRLEADEVRRYCGTCLPSYKKPRLVSFLDELPRTDLGKPSLSELEDRALAALCADAR